MKLAIFTLLASLLLLMTNCDQDVCESIPLCAQTDVNVSLQLTIDLSRFDAEELSTTRLVKVKKGTGEAIDTLDISSFNRFEDEIIIGRNSTIFFNIESMQVNVVPNLDFKVLIGSPVQEFVISDILVKTIDRECSCPELILQSLQLDGEIIEINAANIAIRP